MWQNVQTTGPGDVNLLLAVLTPTQHALLGKAVNLSLEFCYICCPNFRDKELRVFGDLASSVVKEYMI
jgi:hypothetical protein